MSSPSNNPPEDVAYENTDKELWRKGDGNGNSMSYYEPSIHVTKDGLIGINVGGMVHQKPVEKWHELAGGAVHLPSPIASNNLKERIADKLFEKIKYGVAKTPENAQRSKNDWHYEFAAETLNLILDTILASEEMQENKIGDPVEGSSIPMQFTEVSCRNAFRADLRAMITELKK